ncbi:MAG: MASE3 domain-containing protein [Acidobacteriota bacterium]
MLINDRNNNMVFGWIKISLLLAANFIIAYSLSLGIWEKHIGLIHTILELSCVFVAFSIFVVVWNSYNFNPRTSYHLGFGFIVIGFLDLLHIYYFPSLGLFPDGNYDLSTKYWMAARLYQAFILLAATVEVTRKRGSRLGMFTLTIIISMVLGSVIYKLPDGWPVLLTPDHGLTLTTIMLEISVVVIMLLTIYLRRNDINSSNEARQYYYIAICMAIPAELCFAGYSSITEFSANIGHLLKLSSFIFLFRAVYVESFIYPYKQLNRNRKNMSNILNELPVGILKFDRFLRLRFVNETARKLLPDIAAEGMCGTKMEKLIERYMNTNKTAVELIAMLTNSAFTLRNQVLSVKNDKSEVFKMKVDSLNLGREGYLFIFNEAKKEQALRTLQLQTKTIINAVNNAVVMFDENKRIVICNRAFQELTELAETAVIGANFETLLEVLSPQCNLELMKKHQTGDGYPVVITTPHGVHKNVLFNIAPVHNVDSELIGTIMIAADVTNLEREKNRQQQQEKLAALGQMAAGIADEIRNPLTTISGFGQMVLQQANDDVVREFASMIIEESRAVNKVVTDFLMFARPTPPRLKRSSMNRVLESMSMMFENRAYLNGVDIEFNLCDVEQEVLLDEAQIKQVLLNLIQNGIEAARDRDYPALLVETGMDEENKQMMLTVTDNGYGMSSEVISSLGTPFFTTKDTGTGLGLSISFQIIKEHCGAIELNSIPGSGTSISISLPFAGGEGTKVYSIFDNAVINSYMRRTAIVREA